MSYQDQPILKAILGPTNTGKTHYAIERMLGHSSGVIGLPLRLLAREIYDRIVLKKGKAACALITGEEKIIPPFARYYVCTVEAMPVEKRFAFLAIDEVQLMANHERGHIFTDRVLHARAMEETLFLGAETARPVLAALVPKIRFEHRERFSVLNYSGATKITRLPKRSVIVAFSSAQVYALAELIRRFRGGAAVVMGGLSPRTRNAQADLFQSGEVDFLVATDAVGMGLNLDTDHVAFAGLTKYDGRRRRYLTPMEAGQIAGRAGRFRNDGTFGTTGDCPPMDDELIKRIETHEFEPLHYAEWRNSDLDFTSLQTLFDTLHTPRPEKRLRRIKGADDEAALERLTAIDEISNTLHTRAQVKQLWDVCQVPDFRNLTIDTHVKLLQDIYRMLLKGGGKLPNDFMAKRIESCDDIMGGVDILSARLAHIRTWTYCASKTNWMIEKNHWINVAREVEDRLSDALHESLTERFVDRRTSKLLKGMGAKAYMNATIKDNGDVFVDDVLIGQLDGLRFTIDKTTTGLEAKALEATAAQTVAPEIDRRLTSLCSGTHQIFTLSDKGEILWGGTAIGKIAPSGSVFTPDAAIIGAELGNENLRRLAEDRMREFLRAEVALLLTPLIALKEFCDLETASAEAKGFAFILLENNGAIERYPHLKTIRALGADIRRELRTLGIVFGQYNVFMTEMLRPKPARLLSLLIAYGAGGDKNPFIPFAGVTSIPNTGALSSENFSQSAMALAGYKAVGTRIIRFDILNRLAFMIRDAQAQFKAEALPGNHGQKFQLMQEMLALLGSGYEDAEAVLTALRFKSETVKASLTQDIMHPNAKSSDAPTPALTADMSAPDSLEGVADTQKQAQAQAPELTPETTSETISGTSPEKSSTAEQADTPLQSQTPPEKHIPDDSSASGTASGAAQMAAQTEQPQTEPIKTEPAKPAAKPKKQDTNKRMTPYSPRDVAEDGTVTFKPNLTYWFIPARGQKGFKPNQNKGKKPNPRYNKHNKSSKNDYQNHRQKSAKPAQNRARKLENSPFAALAALQTPKKDT